MENEKEIFENMRKNSVAKFDKEKLKLNIKRISAALAVSLVIGATATISTGCGPYGFDVQQAYNDNFDNKQTARDLMERHGMTPGEDYSVEDYLKIAELRDDHLSGFYDLLGYSESEKVAQALGYEDWADYLSKNNYVDQFGKPSFNEWMKNWGHENSKGADYNEHENSRIK